MTEFEAVQTISSAHPALPGHFPGNPVVPGVVILELVRQALVQWQPGCRATELRNAKFTSPLLAQERLHILLKQKGERDVAFVCRVAQREVAQGRFKLKPAGE